MADYTPEQQAYLEEVKQKYLKIMRNMVYHPRKARELVDYSYSLINLTPPDTIYECESIVGAQLMANYLETFHADDKFPTKKKMKEIEKKLVNIYYHKTEELPEEWKKLDIRSKFLCWRMDISEIPWIADYEAVHHLYSDKEKVEKFEKYADLLLKAGIFMCITYDTICLVIKPPEYIEIHPDMKLDSAERPVIKFKDGTTIHYLNNHFLTRKEWEQFFPNKPVTKELVKQIFNISNVEKRTAVVKAIGWEKLLEHFPDLKLEDKLDMKRRIHANGEVIETTENAKLYSFTYEREKRVVVCLPDTSTEKWYYILVPSDLKTVREAAAWHLQITPAQYDQIAAES